MPEASNHRPLGLFGGTFDPVHFGHLRLAEEAVDALGLERVRWIPAGNPALRKPPIGNATQRLEMVRVAIADNPRFELDAAEALSAQPSYTVSTLERLRREDACGAQRPLVLLIGADAFYNLTNWHRWEELFNLAHIAVAHRPGFPIDVFRLPPVLASHYHQRLCEKTATLAETSAGRVACFAMTQLDISATKIRALLSKGLSTRYLMPNALASYIQEHHLYSEI